MDGEQNKTLSLYTGPKVKIQIVKDCATVAAATPYWNVNSMPYVQRVCLLNECVHRRRQKLNEGLPVNDLSKSQTGKEIKRKSFRRSRGCQSMR